MAQRRLTRFLILRSCAEYWLRVVAKGIASSVVMQPEIHQIYCESATRLCARSRSKKRERGGGG